MIGLGDPERIVIDCAGDDWYICGPDGAVRTVAAPGDVEDFVAPAEATRRWAAWLSEAVSGGPPVRAWTILAPTVFGAPRRGIVAAGAAALGVDATVVSRAEALVRGGGLLYCRRALVLECRGPVAQAHVLDLVDGSWVPVAAASHPDPAAAARAVFDDRIDQALIDGPPDVEAAVREELAAQKLWRVVRVDPGDLLPALARPAAPEAEAESEPEFEAWPSADQPRRRGVRRAVVAAAGVTGVAAAAIACLPSTGGAGAPERPAQPPESFVQVAFDGTVVDLPRGWDITEPAPGRRLAQAGDGRRVTVVRTRLRASTDQAAVAAELKSELDRRGDHRISDLDPAGSVAGRDVIGYRERLAADRVVDWYVVVAGDAQLSVGCEAGRTAAPLAGACERAVGSVRPD
ncbi:type VII secretion-associated protein [Tsukamurella strandjordii]|uniref:Type VII secretion-associated protein n=1 Tax=Tsukamurella strandjordii TaxID=147577 RepID=A0AA90NGU5_9ACTN|nr:type VII secretion-associated protein [Tsukamurella strandjordii]MDP0398051.1 type VII secretion-associated protein [Tsukamurella strandjordii]